MAPVRDFPLEGRAERARAWLERSRSPGGSVAGWTACSVAGSVVVPKPAATVMLVRDATAGDEVEDEVEVFMLRRTAAMAFAPKVWVFPGGGVDPRDDAPDLPWTGPSAKAWAHVLGCEESLARALVAAAVREVFEECGVLLAGPSPESVVADLRAPEWDRDRVALLAREQSLAEMLLRRCLVLRSDLLSVQGRWITPEFEPRRYDTWFFAALLPSGQVPDDDTSEADHADWARPRQLLAKYRAGRALLLPPTIVSLEALATAGSAVAFVTRAAAVRPVAPILVEVDGIPVVRCDLP